MVGSNWSVVEFAARLLEQDEREAVLGDLEETQAGAVDRLFGVVGLAARRQVLLWKSWRPWMAGFAVALPGSFLLMGFSLSVSWSYRRLLCPDLLRSAELTKDSGLFILLWQALLLIAWAWSGGFVVGATSKRTVWVSALFCYGPCLFCWSSFRVRSLSRYCLLLFLLPAIWGVVQGMRVSRLERNAALLLAVTVTVLIIPGWSSGGVDWWSPRRQTFDWMLSWPAWYLVLTAKRPGSDAAAV